MGDRANVIVKDGDNGQVCFYGHWAGRSMYGVAKQALELKERWDDAQYLAAIFARRMFYAFDTALEGTTGLGISQVVHDNGHPVLVIDVPAQKVYYTKDDGLTRDNIYPEQTFAEFIAAPSYSVEANEESD